MEEVLGFRFGEDTGLGDQSMVQEIILEAPDVMNHDEDTIMVEEILEFGHDTFVGFIVGDNDEDIGGLVEDIFGVVKVIDEHI